MDRKPSPTAQPSPAFCPQRTSPPQHQEKDRWVGKREAGAGAGAWREVLLASSPARKGKCPLPAPPRPSSTPEPAEDEAGSALSQAGALTEAGPAATEPRVGRPTRGGRGARRRHGAEGGRGGLEGAHGEGLGPGLGGLGGGHLLGKAGKKLRVKPRQWQVRGHTALGGHKGSLDQLGKRPFRSRPGPKRGAL